MEFVLTHFDQIWPKRSVTSERKRIRTFEKPKKNTQRLLLHLEIQAQCPQKHSEIERKCKRCQACK